ncbi:MAG: hypothetical protein HMLKMBBP_03489 [Planctomycetes bacterium]|nr:hypothetical protein [Planctomycetota bacterium]
MTLLGSACCISDTESGGSDRHLRGMPFQSGYRGPPEHRYYTYEEWSAWIDLQGYFDTEDVPRVGRDSDAQYPGSGDRQVR